MRNGNHAVRTIHIQLGGNPMTTRNANAILAAKWAEGKFLCVGLDPDLKQIPEEVGHGESHCKRVFLFCRAIIDTTKDVVCAYKLNWAFFLSLGDDGLRTLRMLVQYIKQEAPDVLIIIDAKVEDIGNTNSHYATTLYLHLGADSVTVHCYLGHRALGELADNPDKLVFVLCRTSNPGSGEFQDLQFMKESEGGTMTLYEYVAWRVSEFWNHNRNLGLVTGATYSEDIAKVRQYAPQLPLLIPGIGTQGGDLEAAVRNGRNKDGVGFIINSSSGIIFASSGRDFAEAARREAFKLHGEILAIV